MRLALVHDWLTGFRGGEKVLLAILELLGPADIFTIVHKKGSLPDKIEQNSITTSFIDKMPFAGKKYQYYLPLMPFAVEQFDLSGYDVVISSSHCVAKGVITRYDTLHISYVHTPMRYAYELFGTYFGSSGLKRNIVSLFMPYLRMWDYATAARVDYFIANSENIKRRISKHYRRDSTVIYPPVDISRFAVKKRSGDYYFMLSALVEYKKVDLAIRAFNELKLPLVIAGKGVMEKYLKSIAGKTIEFVGALPDDKVAEYYSNAKAFIFPGEEDFGITPVEAMACGVPVIAYGSGGALETVQGVWADTDPSKDALKYATGLFFKNQTVEDLKSSVRLFEKNGDSFNPEFVRSSVIKFDKENFRIKFKSYFDYCIKHFKEGSVC